MYRLEFKIGTCSSSTVAIQGGRSEQKLTKRNFSTIIVGGFPIGLCSMWGRIVSKMWLLLVQKSLLLEYTVMGVPLSQHCNKLI